MFRLGETTAITCSTPVPVQSIQWLDESDREWSSASTAQDLTLNFSIDDCRAVSVFTCGVHDGGLFTETQEVSIEASCGSDTSNVVTAVVASVGLALAVVIMLLIILIVVILV